MPEKCIILENKPAHRPTARSNSLSRDSVLRGSLLVELTEGEARESQQHFPTPLNYKKYSNDLVKLYCEPEYVRQLNETQFNLLLAVKYPLNCYKALDILHWVEKLKVGDNINVSISASPQDVSGIIRYIGPLPGKEGTIFGVELLERRGEGTTDGTFRSVKYFKCEHKCGVFVGMDKLSGPENDNASSPGAEDNLLKLGDGVIFYDEREKPVKGTVRWIGVNRVAMPSGNKIVGIETVQKVVIPGSLHGMNHFFTLHNSKAMQLFLPMNSVMKDEINSPPVTNVSGHLFRRSISENASQPDLEYQDLQDSSNSQTLDLCSSLDSATISGVPRNRLSPSIHSYGNGHKSNQTRSHSCDSLTWSPVHSNPNNLEIGSRILYGSSSRSGVIKWMGYPIGMNKYFAGIEMDEPIADSTDGVWRGVKYFDSHPGRGMFQRVDSLRPAIEVKLEKSTDQTSAETELLSSYESTEASTPFHHDLANLENQDLQINCNNHGNQLVTSNATVDKLQQNMTEIEKQQKVNVQDNRSRMEAIESQLVEIQRSNEQLRAGNDHLKNQLSFTQQQLSDIQKSNKLLQISNEHLKNQFSIIQQQLIDVQRNNELLQLTLQNQSSLTQQQLLGVQSLMSYSRWWVVSHDQFTIGKEIGRGAWATVHETRFRGATVAAKCLHQLLNAPRTRQLFQREMEMALQCQHQNIVTFLGTTLEGPPVILMELMDTNLRSAYEQGHIRDHQVLGILYDTASALHFLHTRPDPVIHRDVSSANVLLKAQSDGEWLAKLGDLGTAKIQQQAATAGPGAIAYGAPEAGDFTKHSPKMDVYSYGVLILEILTKTHPFQVADALKVQVQQQFPQYHHLVTSCTNQKSNDRPTMYDIINQLGGIKTANP